MALSDRYNDYFMKRTRKNQGVEDLSGPIPSSAYEIDWLGNSNLTQNDNISPMMQEQSSATSSGSAGSGAVGAAKSLASGGSTGDAVSSGLIASGNPYAVGVGLGLMTLSNINKRKQQEKQDKYVAEVRRLQAKQEALNRLAEIGQKLKA